MAHTPLAEPAVRPAAPADIDAILTLQATAPECAQWPRSAYAAIFSAPPDAPLRRGIFCAWAGEKLAGFAVASALHAAQTCTCELENMAVATGQRRQGVGRALVAAVQAWSLQQQAACVQLEVRASNQAAIQLYGRQGFVAVGRRPGYYSQPADDALQMTWIPADGAPFSC